MLKFFRLIRKRLFLENNTSRYLAYAAGEILLVVLGILIALQINNWNEVRKAKQQEQQLFIQILSDLQSDSIQIADKLVEYQNRQNLHYHLYNEMKGNASYDSTLQYEQLPFAFSFNPITKENYQPIIENIINEKVRASLNTYFRWEEIAISQEDRFLRLQENRIRPYLSSNNIFDIDAAFSSPQNAFKSDNSSLEYEAMKAQFDSPEFGQILYGLRGITAGSIMIYGRLKEENSKLQKTIQQALKK